MQNQALAMPDFNLKALGDGTGQDVQKSLANVFAGEAKQIAALTGKLSGEEQLLEDYANVQHVQLGKLQFRLLDSITDSKMYDAPLRDVVAAFKILKDKELVAQGKPTEIVGLVGYLEVLEKEENTPIDITPGVDMGVTPFSDDAENQLNLFEMAEPIIVEESLPCL